MLDVIAAHQIAPHLLTSTGVIGRVTQNMVNAKEVEIEFPAIPLADR
jgi:hypothetical protein